MSRGVAAAAGAAALLFALITLVRVRSARVDAAADASRDTTSAPTAGVGIGREGVREFWETYHQATELRWAGRFSDARDAYRRALELDPRHEDALYYLGNVQLELGDYAAAGSAWERLVAVNPQSARAHSRLGDLYACVDAGAPRDVARAVAEFRRAAELNREETGPLLHLGELALIQGDLAGATSYLDAVIGSHAGSVEARFLEGYVAWKRAQPARAAALFAKAVALARPVAPAQKPPGEGDTKRGPTPIVARTSRCQVFPAYVERLSGVEDAELPNRMNELYQRLDRRLAELAPRAPS